MSCSCVPASLTRLLQPLDTHAFLKYKRSLRRAYQKAWVRGRVCDLDIAVFLTCVYEVIRTVLQGNAWARAFVEDGFSAGQAGLARWAQRNVGAAAPLAVNWADG